MFCCVFRLYSHVSSFLTPSNIQRVMKLRQMVQSTESLVQYYMCYIYISILYVSVYFYCRIKVVANEALYNGPFTAVSRSGLDTCLSEKLPDTSSACLHMDYTPFIRCSAALSLLLSRSLFYLSSMHIKLE